MKRLATLLALLAVSAAPAFAANALRISQIYGGGGATSGTPTYNVDYVEIYNSGNVAVNIGGWCIQYGSTSGLWASVGTNLFTFPVGTTIQPCQYMLVANAPPAPGGGILGAALPIPPDFNFTLSMSASAGKVLLSSASNAGVACGAETGLVDKIGYGTGSNCPETSIAPLLTNQQGDVRNNAGNTDTDNNGSDFTAVTNPTPRNTSSPKNPACLVTPTRSSTWGAVKSIYR